MNSYRAIGFLFGITFGVIVSIFILRAFNKNRSIRTEYDEMQKQARGEAYMYGFYAMILFEFLTMLTEFFQPIPAEPLVIHFTAIMIGVTVQAVYSIMHDAFIGLNTQKNRYLIIMAVIAVINFAVAFAAFKDGRMIENGVLMAPFCNLMVGIAFLIIGLAGWIRTTEGKEEKE